MSGFTLLSGSVADQIIASALSACGGFCNTNLTAGSAFVAVANTLTFIIGAASVIMVIFAGFRFTTSGGDAKHVAEAKFTILYAVLGVVTAISAYAIVSFVSAALG